LAIQQRHLAGANTKLNGRDWRWLASLPNCWRFLTLNGSPKCGYASVFADPVRIIHLRRRRILIIHHKHVLLIHLVGGRWCGLLLNNQFSILFGDLLEPVPRIRPSEASIELELASNRRRKRRRRNPADWEFHVFLCIS
jgi:hypothetical protein